MKEWTGLVLLQLFNNLMMMPIFYYTGTDEQICQNCFYYLLIGPNIIYGPIRESSDLDKLIFFLSFIIRNTGLHIFERHLYLQSLGVMETTTLEDAAFLNVRLVGIKEIVLKFL